MMKRKHTKASDWLPVIQEWKTSGLNKKVFCQKKNINYKTFYRWYTQLAGSPLPSHRSATPQDSRQNNVFIPVEISCISKMNNLADKPCVLYLNAKLQLHIPTTAITVNLLRILFEATEVTSC